MVGVTVVRVTVGRVTGSGESVQVLTLGVVTMSNTLHHNDSFIVDATERHFCVNCF